MSRNQRCISCAKVTPYCLQVGWGWGVGAVQAGYAPGQGLRRQAAASCHAPCLLHALLAMSSGRREGRGLLQRREGEQRRPPPPAPWPPMCDAPCLPPRAQCSDARTCTKCWDGYLLQNGRCLPCSPGCTDCSRGLQTCDACESFHVLDAPAQRCVPL